MQVWGGGEKRASLFTQAQIIPTNPDMNDSCAHEFHYLYRIYFVGVIVLHGTMVTPLQEYKRPARAEFGYRAGIIK